PGGPGNLPMAVESIIEDGDFLTARVTSADYIFNKNTGTLEVRQRIDYQRPLARYEGLPLTGLSVQTQNAKEAVLIGDDLTIGLQADGALVISPHQETTVTTTSIIGGDFNRLEGGDFFSLDDFGGFTTSIYTPKGTGLIPQLTPITLDLPFVGLNSADLESSGAAEENWQTEMTVRPGERIFISAFPSRPYDWEKSFDYTWALSDWNFPTDQYDDPKFVEAWILWNISQRGWAMSFGERYELRDNVPFQEHWDAINTEGDKWGAYFSQWFYYSRDGEEWANEVKRWRDEYGMTAMYSDGLAEDDFLSAYIAMRVLREDVFPDGDLVIHDSYPQSGVPAANYKPFIHTYATSTYMGEFAFVEAGADWEWARHVMGQFRRANCFGVTKGDQWIGFQGVEKYLVALVWGGRSRPDVADYDLYLNVLNGLKAVWEIYGDDPYFFDRYYHPEAQTLTGYNIGRAGMPIDLFNTNQTELVLSSWTPGATIHYTLDGSEPTTNSPAYTAPIAWDSSFGLRAKAFRDDLEESRMLEINGDVFTANREVIVEDVQPALVSAFPNPSNLETTIRYFLPQSSQVAMQIVDLTGQVVQSFDNNVRAAGYHLQTVTTDHLANGVYFISMQVNGIIVAPLKLMVIQ
ncbi:MAG: chitobiase/beta-hexosaminidase C-terminal domain-containing protein, partial [Bacteroidota bacterium]